MPCSHCGGSGHNRRTCPLLRTPPTTQPPPPPTRPQPTRNITIQPNSQLYRNLLSTFNSMNLGVYPRFYNETGGPISVYSITTDNRIKYMTTVLENDNITNLVNYSIGTELIGTDTRLPDNSDYGWIQQNLSTQILFSCTFVTNRQIIRIERVDNSETWKRTAIKMKYLLDELVRLGGNDDTRYPNLAPVLDLVQDLDVPEYSELDRENAGVPSTLTNVS